MSGICFTPENNTFRKPYAKIAERDAPKVLEVIEAYYSIFRASYCLYQQTLHLQISMLTYKKGGRKASSSLSQENT